MGNILHFASRCCLSQRGCAKSMPMRKCCSYLLSMALLVFWRRVMWWLQWIGIVSLRVECWMRVWLLPPARLPRETVIDCTKVWSVKWWRVVLATGPNSRVGSGSGSTRNQIVAMGLTTRKTQTVGNGPVLPPKTRHFKFPILAPIKYLSYDRIVIWSVRTLCSFSRSFTSRCQICDWTNIRWVAVENPRISLIISCYFTAILRILVGSQIWKREVKERIILHNLHTDHITIRS